MEQFSSTRAKQSFGELLKAAALGPVAIERHGKVQAIVAAPGYFTGVSAAQDEQASRRLARANQSVVEKDRLIRHQRIALDLVTLPADERDRMIEQALAVVQRWRQERLCSSDYIERWSALLKLPAVALAMAMVSDADGWGPALRQNSPWVGVHA
ncbi:type II toxin-antitoxin system Phd/YefM family antitoxin [Aquabacterium sp.]|uniref:type II toxin-antitoxin system Phd/YefM family antitoxin n=1 Tax=Aquabacterium sp. TaxID=1872578 RepID=UPI002CE71B6A|nr:type II toxin-antitoxin system Phd/YefM family antitoxin [Aquabacterium sp.]HSW05114.1 type II toxin-antitoxin system Phd/YefM family antitoxin [Aquabacterium sp.]